MIVTFELPEAEGEWELTMQETSDAVRIMGFTKERIINQKKVDLAKEYRFLADIVGKVLLCKISALELLLKTENYKPNQNYKEQDRTVHILFQLLFERVRFLYFIFQTEIEIGFAT